MESADNPCIAVMWRLLILAYARARCLARAVDSTVGILGGGAENSKRTQAGLAVQ
jgi:hypothetical protein